MASSVPVIVDSFPILLKGLLVTLQYSILGIAFSIPAGVIAGLAKLSQRRICRYIANIYIEIFRGTPLLVQILFIYAGLPLILPLQEWFGGAYLLIAATVALALNEGAYIAEIVRGGIVSINKGQWDASYSLGMNRTTLMIFVIMPQALKRMIPPLVNQFAQTIKDTSLLAVISGAELIYTGEVLIAKTFLAFQFWLVIAVIYFIMIYSLTRFASYLEKKFGVRKH